MRFVNKEQACDAHQFTREAGMEAVAFHNFMELSEEEREKEAVRLAGEGKPVPAKLEAFGFEVVYTPGRGFAVADQRVTYGDYIKKAAKGFPTVVSKDVFEAQWAPAVVAGSETAEGADGA